MKSILFTLLITLCLCSVGLASHTIWPLIIFFGSLPLAIFLGCQIGKIAEIAFFWEKK